MITLEITEAAKKNLLSGLDYWLDAVWNEIDAQETSRDSKNPSYYNEDELKVYLSFEKESLAIIELINDGKHDRFCRCIVKCHPEYPLQ